MSDTALTVVEKAREISVTALKTKLGKADKVLSSALKGKDVKTAIVVLEAVGTKTVDISRLEHKPSSKDFIARTRFVLEVKLAGDTVIIDNCLLRQDVVGRSTTQEKWHFRQSSTDEPDKGVYPATSLVKFAEQFGRRGALFTQTNTWQVTPALPVK